MSNLTLFLYFLKDLFNFECYQENLSFINFYNMVRLTVNLDATILALKVRNISTPNVTEYRHHLSKSFFTK